MKKTTSVILILMLFISLASRAEETYSTGFLFPEYQKGKVYFKSKEKSEALLNYQTITKQMYFLKEKQPLVLAYAQATDSVVIAGRVFVYFENSEFFEKKTAGKGDLYVQYGSKMLSAASAVGYGGYSQVSNAKSLGFISTTDGGATKSLTRLQVDEKYKLDMIMSFWIKQNGKFVNVPSAKKLMKLFPEKKSLIQTYLNDHKVNYESLDDVRRLFDYCFSIQ